MSSSTYSLAYWNVTWNATRSNISSNISSESSPSRGAVTWVEYRVAVALLEYGLPLIILVGTLGNSLAVVVLIRRRMRLTSISFYLAMLAVADTLVLYLSGFKTWLRTVTGFEVLHISSAMCKGVMLVLLISLHMSAWLVVAMTMDRFVSIWLPLKVSQICHVKKARRATVALLLITVLINIHALWTMKLKTGPHPRCAADTGDSFMMDVYPYLKLLSYSALPFVAVSSLNMCILLQLWRKRDALLKPTRGQQVRGVSRKYQNQVTVMLLCVSFVWLVLTAPFTMWSLVTPKSDEPQRKARFLLLKVICFLLMYTNHSINFFIYCITGRKFRRELNIMCQKRRCKCIRVLMRQNSGNRMIQFS